jgi:hypothetical protein
MVAPSVEAVVPRSRLSTTPGPGPSPCDRARHEYFLVTLPTVGSINYTLLWCPTGFGAHSTVPVVGSASPPRLQGPPPWPLGSRWVAVGTRHPSPPRSAPWLTLPPPLQIGWSTSAPPITPLMLLARYLTLIHSFHPIIIIMRNSSTLSVTSVGDSVLPRPFYLKIVLVAPHIIQVFFLFVSLPPTTLVPLSLTLLVYL